MLNLRQMYTCSTRPIVLLSTLDTANSQLGRAFIKP
jgi:hypothetical protein